MTHLVTGMHIEVKHTKYVKILHGTFDNMSPQHGPTNAYLFKYTPKDTYIYIYSRYIYKWSYAADSQSPDTTKTAFLKAILKFLAKI